MLSFALGALIVALFAGVVGFGAAAGTPAGVALIVFYVFLGMFVLGLVGMAVDSQRQPTV